MELQSKTKTRKEPIKTQVDLEPEIRLSKLTGVVLAAPHAVKEAGSKTASGGAIGFSDHGGTIIPNVQLLLLFWGSYWAGSPSPAPNDISNAANVILTGHYMTGLSQYRGIQSGHLVGSIVVSDSNPPNNFTDTHVTNFISNLVNTHRIASAATNNQLLYMVIMPPGVNNANSGFIGEHSFFTISGRNFHFAWITNNGSLNSITSILSHELVESVTDPEGSAILGNPGTCSQGGWCEIGDVCYENIVVDRVTVQKYWSQNDRQCWPTSAIANAWVVNVAGVPTLLQSRFGIKGNFEFITPVSEGGLEFMWRNNDDPSMPWSMMGIVGARATHYDAVTMIQSNYGSPGNLEVVARTGSSLHFFWRDSGPAFHWNGPIPLASGVTGNPVLRQSRFGHQGNFELIVPLAAGGLGYMWRNNDVASMPWSALVPIGPTGTHYDAVTMIQSNYGTPGNMEVVARSGSTLHFYWRDSGPAFHWNGPFPLVSGVSGNPVLLQSRFGHQGNFELIVPLVSGGLGYMWRNNDVGTMPWSALVPIGPTGTHYDSVTMIQSNYGSPGNMEVIARRGNILHFYWRDSGPAFHWNGPFVLNYI